MKNICLVEKHILITHNDLDGDGCKFLMEKALNSRVSVHSVSNSGVDKAIQTILSKNKYKNAVLWIADVSPETKEIEEKLEYEFKRGRKIILLDHHESALHLNKYKWAKVQEEYSDGRKTSATSLLFESLIEEGMLQSTKFIETFVEMVRLYDTWEWEKINDLKPKMLNDLYYILGMSEFNRKLLEKSNECPNSEFYFDEVEKLIVSIEQKKINHYVLNKAKRVVKIILGDKVIGVVHAENYISELGNELAKIYPYLDAIAIVHTANKRISMRTIHEDVNVVEIAKKFDGGGHPKASGFTIDKRAYKIFLEDIYFLEYIKPDVENKFNTKNENKETYYEDDKGYVIIIKRIGSDYLVHGNPISKDLNFKSFEEAESYIKKWHKVNLMEDDKYILFMSEKLNIKPDHLRSQFKKIID